LSEIRKNELPYLKMAHRHCVGLELERRHSEKKINENRKTHLRFILWLVLYIVRIKYTFFVFKKVDIVKVNITRQV